MSSDKNPVKEELYLEPNPTFEEIEEQIREMEKENNQAEEKPKKIRHLGFAEDSPVQQYVQYAYEIGGLDLVTILDCENGYRDMYRQSTIVNKYGQREESYGFCQIHRPSQPDIVDNPLFWSDWRWQLDRCKEIRDRELNDGRTRFYAEKRKINGVLCPKYVESRFILE